MTPEAMSPDLVQQQRLLNLRQKFIALLDAEVRLFGGIADYRGRTGKEQRELRSAVAELVGIDIPEELS